MPKITVWKAEDDYYGAHGGFLLEGEGGSVLGDKVHLKYISGVERK